MIKKITGVMLILMLLCIGFTQAQTSKTLSIKLPNKVVAGNELGNPGVIQVPQITKPNYRVLPRMAGTLMFTFTETGVFTGYDVVSNATPQELWIDPSDPTQLHAVEMWSPQDAGWGTRNIKYFYSFDAGDSWQETATLPLTDNRSGYPTIDGFSDETPLVGMHTFLTGETSADTRGLFWKDDSPGAGTFTTQYDPGYGPNTAIPLIWPRNVVIDDNNYAIAESQNLGTDSMYVDFYNSTNGFAGWQSFPGSQAETYSLAVSEDGSTVGLLFVGNSDATHNGKIFYTQTTDMGASWSDLLTLYDGVGNPDSLAPIRGCDLIFLGDLPCATFELLKQDLVGGSYFPGAPSKIMYWNGNMSSSIVIADSNNVPFYDNFESTNDVFGPICRPSIGRSSRGGALFVAFNANTPYYLEDANGNANNYYACWFTMSFDSGATWSAPVQFTQDTVNGTMMDWRFPSLAPISYVPAGDSVCTVQMVVQSDTIPGSTFSAPAGYPVAVSSELQSVKTMVTIPSLIDTTGSDVRGNIKSPFTFSLLQNYPNPFNPSTKIQYSIASRSNVTLKIFDMLGREVATLINTVKEPGNYTINFDASKLASGMYIYRLNAGSFTSSKKMVLLK